MRTPTVRPLFAALLVLTALVAAACGGGDDPTLTPPSDEAASSASANDADIEFVQGMIPHHQQATAMAELVQDRTERDELRQFAAKIINDQTAEIDQMRNILAAAGADEDGMGGMDMGADDGGMMDDSEMAELEGLSGDEFDIAFLDAMTRHHDGAIEMAQQVLENGENAEVADLANRIIEAQQAEIEQMAAWREEWAQ